MTRTGLIAMAMLVGMALAIPVDADDWGSTRSFEQAYSLSPTTSLTGLTGGCLENGLCPYAGVLMCAPNGWLRLRASGTGGGGDGPGPLDLQQTSLVPSSGVGGACLDINLNAGDNVTIGVDDEVADAVSVAACQDGDGDGLCREDVGSGDFWALADCLAPGDSLDFQAVGRGRLQVFVLSRLDTELPCAASAGMVAVAVNIQGRPPECSDLQDNDGDGFTDWSGGDPECDDPFDDTEDPPPIWIGN